MRKTLTITYPADPSRVAQMLADPAYQRARVARFGLDDVDVDVATRGQGFVATSTGSVPAGRLPSAVKRFVRSAVSFRILESWNEAGADGSRSGTLDLDVKGAPVKVTASSTLAPTGDGRSTVTMEVDASVSVPLIGRSIEDRALGQAHRVVADEERRAGDWLAQHGE